MKKIVVLVLCSIIVVSCKKSVQVIQKGQVETLEYSIPFEDGFFLTDKDKLKIKLKLFESGKVFTYDMGIRLHIYMELDRGIEDIDPQSARIFFIRAGGPTYYGFMKPENLDIDTSSGNDKRILVSAKIKSKIIYPIRHQSENITIMFKNLPVTKVDSMKEFLKMDDDFFLEKLKQYFPGY